MSSAEFITGGEGDFFVQVERADVFQHLTCIGAGDIPLPKGELTPEYCPDESEKGKWAIDDFIQGEPGAGATTLARPLSPVANWLLEQDCAFEGFITYACRGARGDPENYTLGVLLYGMRISDSRILAQAVSRVPADQNRVMTDADLSYIDRLLIYQLRFDRLTIENTATANGIVMLPKACETRCGPARDACEEGYLALDGALYNAEVKYTRDGWATAIECTADPFDYGGNAGDVIVFETVNGHRAIVSRSSAVAGAAAEVGYSDVAMGDAVWCQSWTNVDLGAVAGQTISRMFKQGGRVWAAASGGYIYYSESQAAGWSVQEAAIETTQDLNDISMYSSTQGYAVGNNNAFLYTNDGEQWNSRTGPAPGVNLLSVAVNDKGHVFVGAADGGLYVSEDEGQTWVLRFDFGNGSIDRIKFDAKLHYVGALIFNDAAGTGYAYRSKDGGASWQRPAGQSADWNSGLRDVFICDQNHILVAGAAHEGTTFVALAAPG